MHRNILCFVPLAVLIALTWGRSEPAPWVRDAPVAAIALAMPPPAVLSRYLGPFRFEGGWQLRSRGSRFTGYSSMVPMPDGRIFAFDDGGDTVRFTPPDAPLNPVFQRITFNKKKKRQPRHDVESVAHDPDTGRYWLGVEGSNSIFRLSPDLVREGRADPPAMAQWGRNTGPEAMTRLPDGRFVVIREITRSLWDSRLHEAVLFDGDPVLHPDGHKFLFDGESNFSVVDMAMLPDGRALILMRRLLWPLPMRFAGRIVIADTAQIRPGRIWRSETLADIASVLPVDNFEAIGVVPGRDGRITVWLMSDDNDFRVLQRTLLWKLSANLRSLPWPHADPAP